MTFYTWMMKTYKGKDSPEGDFAYDIWRDRETFPRNPSCKFNGGRRSILHYLWTHHADHECIPIFMKCWNEYEMRERKRLGMKPEAPSCVTPSGIDCENHTVTCGLCHERIEMDDEILEVCPFCGMGIDWASRRGKCMHWWAEKWLIEGLIYG